MIRNIWIIMIGIGPLLIILGAMMIMFSAQDTEWVTVYTESDFYREGGDYSLYSLGSNLDDDMRVIIKDKRGTSVSVRFEVDDLWGDEIFSSSGMTPETYYFNLDDPSLFDEYEFHIDIYTDDVTISDLDIELQKQGLGDSFMYFCLGSSLIILLGVVLVTLGIIFTLIYSNKIKKEDPEYQRAEMIRKQENMAREAQLKRAQEMERNRQKQMMLIRARNLESSYRLEEAASMYDRLEMYDDAGRCRRRLKEEISRHIHVNANQLFDALQQRGTAIPYLCPSCHGMVDIDGLNKRYTSCPYCGASVDFETLRKVAGNLMG